MHFETDAPSGAASERRSSQQTLLCVGNDEALLSYRCKVLSQSGFEVIAARPQPDQSQQFANLCRLHGLSMAIACHTLMGQQRISLARELRDACPEVKLLALTNGSLPPSEASDYDLLLDSLDGPAALIQLVRANV